MNNHPARTLERVAELLPQAEKERFLVLVARFKSIPHDDEYLQVLEAIGFMTLLWKSVPQDIERILEGASPVRESAASLQTMIRQTVGDAIPSHQDLRSISETLKGHEIALRGMLTSRQPGRSDRSTALALLSLIGIIIIAILGLQLGSIKIW